MLVGTSRVARARGRLRERGRPACGSPVRVAPRGALRPFGVVLEEGLQMRGAIARTSARTVSSMHGGFLAAGTCQATAATVRSGLGRPASMASADGKTRAIASGRLIASAVGISLAPCAKGVGAPAGSVSGRPGRRAPRTSS